MSKTIFFPSNTLIYGISRDGSKNFNIRTCEHVILGQLRIWAHTTTYAALVGWWPELIFVTNITNYIRGAKLPCGKFQLSLQNLNNLWSFYRILCRFYPKSTWRTICAEKICVEKKWQICMRSVQTGQGTSSHFQPIYQPYISKIIEWQRCLLQTIDIWIFCSSKIGLCLQSGPQK